LKGSSSGMEMQPLKRLLIMRSYHEEFDIRMINEAHTSCNSWCCHNGPDIVGVGMGYMKSRHARSKYKTRSQARKREWTDENPRPPDATEDYLIADCETRDIWGFCFCKRCGKLWSRDVSSVGNQWNITIAALERPCVGEIPAYRPARYNHNPNKLSNTQIFTRDPQEGDT